MYLPFEKKINDWEDSNIIIIIMTIIIIIIIINNTISEDNAGTNTYIGI